MESLAGSSWMLLPIFSLEVPAITIFTATAVLVIPILLIYARIKPSYVDPSVPGPERSRFLGWLPFILAHLDDWPNTVHKLCEKFQGRTFGGPMPCLGTYYGSYFVVNDERNIAYILKENFENYEKGEAFHEIFKEMLGNGIFASDGPTWYRHRKITSRMFSTNLLREASNVTLQKVRILADILKKGLGAEVDLQDLFYQMTFDSTCLVAFGKDYSSLNDMATRQHPFALAFEELEELLTMRLGDPLFRLKRLFRLTRRERRIRQLKAVLDGYAKEVIRAKRRTALDGLGGLGPDILSRFIDHAVSKDDSISDEELRDVILNVLVAGRDTTAVALSWTMFELSRHPHIVQRMIQESEEICGRVKDVNGTDDGDYSYNNVAKLNYTHAVVMESLRLHPPVPSDSKYAIRDDVLPDGTVIPSRAMVGYPPYAMGRSTLIWGDDAGEFKPERFLGKKAPSAFRYPVFNAGTRLCLGKPMALNTIKLTLAYLLPRFDFRDVAGHSGKYKWSLVMTMKGGFPVEVSVRE